MCYCVVVFCPAAWQVWLLLLFPKRTVKPVAVWNVNSFLSIQKDDSQFTLQYLHNLYQQHSAFLECLVFIFFITFLWFVPLCVGVGVWVLLCMCIYFVASLMIPTSLGVYMCGLGLVFVGWGWVRGAATCGIRYSSCCVVLSHALQITRHLKLKVCLLLLGNCSWSCIHNDIMDATKANVLLRNSIVFCSCCFLFCFLLFE